MGKFIAGLLILTINFVWAQDKPGLTVTNYSLTTTIETDLDDHTKGGFVGFNYRSHIESCYSTGSVSSTGESERGGFAGKIDTGGDYADINNYWNTETSGWSTSVMGVGRITSDMTWEYSVNSYEDWDMATDGLGEWLSGDHATVYDHEGNYGYPALGWQEWIDSPIAEPTNLIQPATEITDNSARLNGKITDDGGEPCDVIFRYKKTADIDWTTGSWITTGYSADDEYFENIYSLDERTEYEFQTQARNSAGETGWTPSQIFTTLRTIRLIPRVINYQGKVVYPSGVGINDTLQMTFSLYFDEIDDSKLWTQTIPNVIISRGLFNVELSDFPDSLDFSSLYWLEVNIEGEVITPRKKLDTTPYSFRAIYADTADFVTGAITNQFTTPQSADFLIDGTAGANLFYIVPNAESPESPQAGFVRTINSTEGFFAYIHDGVCWRSWFPVIDTTVCYGEIPFALETTPDTTIDLGESVEIEISVSGGWPPYEYDWDIDGFDDWDDVSVNIVNPETTSVYQIRIRDVTEEVLEDSIIVNVND